MDDGDRLLLMPYSQYSYGCSGHGRFIDIDGLCTPIAAQPGAYEICVVLVGSGLPSHSGNKFIVSLLPVNAVHLGGLTEVPGWSQYPR